MKDFCSDCGLDFQCCIHKYQKLIWQETMVIHSLCPTNNDQDAHCLCYDRIQEYLQELYSEVISNLPAEIFRQEPQLHYLRTTYYEFLS